MKKSLFILPLAFVLALAGCNDGGGSSTSGGSGTSGTTSGTTSEPSKSSSSVIDPQVVTVSLDKDAITLDAFNSKSYHLNATVVTLGNAYDGVSFASDKPAVADVSPDGTVTAYSVGTAVITATSFFDTTKKATCTVSVTDHHPALQHTVSINLGGEDIAMEPMRDIPEGEGGAYQFTKQINVVKNSPISFKLDGANCPAYKDSGVHNVVGDAPGAYKIHNDADSSIYFKAYVDELEVYSYSFYISGYEPAQGWFLKGSFNSWSDADQLELHPDGKPEGCIAQYYIERNLTKGDLMKFQRTTDEAWVGYSNIDTGCREYALEDTGDNNNIRVNVTGSYEFFVQEYETEIKVWVAYPTYIAALYEGEITTGNSINADSLSVTYYTNHTSTDIKNDAGTHYYLGSDEINFSTVFPNSGNYEIRVTYSTYETLFNLPVRNPHGFGIKDDSDVVTLFQYAGVIHEDDRDYQQYKSPVLHFSENQEFTAFDNYTETRFLPALQNLDFDAFVIRDENNNVFVAQQDFYVVAYMKLNPGNDKIYFETNIVHSAEISINGGAPVAMNEMPGPFEDTEMVQQFKITVDAVQNQSVVFRTNGVDRDITDLTGNLKYDSGAKFRYSFDGCDIYLKFYGINGYKAFATYDDAYYLVGLGGVWSKTNENKMVSEPDPGLKEQYTIIKSLSGGDKFKIYSERPEYGDPYVAGFAQLENAGAYSSFEADGDGNIVCKDAGPFNYRIRFKKNSDDQISVFIIKIVAPANSLQVSYGLNYVVKDQGLKASLLSMTYYDSDYFDHNVSIENAHFYVDAAEFNFNTKTFGDAVGTVKTITARYYYEGENYVENTFNVTVAQSKTINIYVDSASGTLGEWYDDPEPVPPQGDEVRARFYIWVWNSSDNIGYLEFIPYSEITRLNDNEIQLAHAVYVGIDRCQVFRCDPTAVYNGYPDSGIWNQAQKDYGGGDTQDLIVYGEPGNYYVNGGFPNT